MPRAGLGRTYLKRVIETLNFHHEQYLNKRGGWQYAQLLDRTLVQLELLLYHLTAESGS